MSHERNVDVLALDVALREAEATAPKPDGASTINVRSVAGESRRMTTHFDIESEGTIRRIDVACGGSPRVCVNVSGAKPKFSRAVHLTADDIETSYWASGGWTFTHAHGEDRSDASAGIGADLTFGLLRYETFVPEVERSFLDVTVLRGGPWLAASTRGEQGDVETGAIVSLGNPHHPSWGAISARGGVGYGEFERERALHGNISLAYGLSWGSSHPSIVAPVGVVRFVGTYRPLFTSPGQEFFFGIEVSPALFIAQRLRDPTPG